MDIENFEVEDIKSNNAEGEFNLEGELVNDLLETERLKKKNKTQKEYLLKDKVEVVEPLLLKLEESRKVQDSLNQQLIEEAQICEKLEGEIVLLKKELEKAKEHLSINKIFNKGT